MFRIISWILKPWRILMDILTLIFLVGVVGGLFTLLNGFEALTSGTIKTEVVRTISENVLPAPIDTQETIRPAEVSEIPTEPKKEPENKEGTWRFYGLSCTCVALWFLILTPLMSATLKKESTPANIWMILTASLFGVILAYCVSSFDRGWVIPLGRGAFLVVEFAIFAFLSMLWMSFLEKRQNG